MNIRKLVLPIFLVALSANVVAQDSNSDERWRIYEVAKLSELIGSIGRGNLGIVVTLNVTEEQLAQLRISLQDFDQNESELNALQRLKRAECKAAILLGKGDPQSLSKELRKLDVEMMELRQKYTDSILSEIFIPLQATRLRQFAKQMRMFRQSTFGDEFGIPIAVANEIEMKSVEKEKLIKVIESIRSDYYSKLSALRKESQNRIIDSLNADQQRKLEKLVGDPYDYQAEIEERVRENQTDAEK